MEQKLKDIVEQLIQCYPQLEVCKEDIEKAFYILNKHMKAGVKR